MPHTRTTLIGFALAAPVAALAIAGCGSSNKDKVKASSPSTTKKTTKAPAAAGGAGQTLKLSADPSGGLKFSTKSLSAKAGKVTVAMTNPSSSGISHAVAVEGNGVDKDGPTADAGATSNVTVDLKPGKYEFYCPVDGHRKAGMEGTLTVK